MSGRGHTAGRAAGGAAASAPCPVPCSRGTGAFSRPRLCVNTSHGAGRVLGSVQGHSHLRTAAYRAATVTPTRMSPRGPQRSPRACAHVSEDHGAQNPCMLVHARLPATPAPGVTQEKRGHLSPGTHPRLRGRRAGGDIVSRTPFLRTSRVAMGQYPTIFSQEKLGPQLCEAGPVVAFSIGTVLGRTLTKQ